MSWKARTTLPEAYQLWRFNKRPRTVVKKTKRRKLCMVSCQTLGPDYYLGRLQHLCTIYLFIFI